ncbi:hypothetical protein H9X96_05840 [Pedobacter sp. N36a]|uniref:hypothetical protein n=1 Tax=Pedobacter sp. N36a TaxID=2767996 RepID=UPI001656E2C5|nr:hypothetical protein [Pedobacter sp. N36a]MBC8985291.1 hypothetical protein [Pedobacter sp. N36a]
MKLRTYVLTIVVTCLIFIGCKKDDFDGKLQISFAVSPSEIDIYTTDNKEIAIKSIKLNSQETTIMVNLNAGNYVIKPFKSGHLYGEKGAQVNRGKTTILQFN